MENTALRELAQTIETTRTVPDSEAVISALADHLPEADRSRLTADAFNSTDAMLLLVDHVFPGWSITIDGVASEKDGHWVCVLRRSSARDNDAFVGIGKCGSLPLALLAAMLNALAFAG